MFFEGEADNITQSTYLGIAYGNATPSKGFLLTSLATMYDAYDNAEKECLSYIGQDLEAK